jgi:excinuclease ABC subunit A
LRAQFIINVGLGYLSLDRPVSTLSGGELQRIRLASQIGSGLVGVLYVLDEPSIGLHAHDNNRLLNTLNQLKNQGNSLLIVEHDEATIRNADYVIDLGPSSGKWGGTVLYQGSVKDISRCKESITGAFLSGSLSIPIPAKRSHANQPFLRLRGVKTNNLKNIDVTFPLGTFIGVSGISGSGKSSLIIDTLVPIITHQKHPTELIANAEGLDQIDRFIYVDQGPIGKTSRSNPSTYTGVLSDIRRLFAQTPEARARGYKVDRFSFNTRSGSCEHCLGQGMIEISMSFLPESFVRCEVCAGRRYNQQTREIKYRGRSIDECLKMTAREALDFFQNVPPILSKLQTLVDVGLEYLELGQNSSTLSGGEAQRIKLSRELGKRTSSKTLYVLDEPTTALHFADIKKLLDILQTLVSQGSTVIVIEHNLDVLKQVDYIIDLGPGAGVAGGQVIFQGSPEMLCKHPDSLTGRYLRPVLHIHHVGAREDARA